MTTCTLQGQLQGRGSLELRHIPVISYIFSNPGAAGYMSIACFGLFSCGFRTPWLSTIPCFIKHRTAHFVGFWATRADRTIQILRGRPQPLSEYRSWRRKTLLLLIYRMHGRYVIISNVAIRFFPFCLLSPTSDHYRVCHPFGTSTLNDLIHVFMSCARPLFHSSIPTC